ncbi:putative histone-lysine N-methyltransferase PRDM6 [Nematostella vectensis]|nr:putative histone-lysine N-methyltransferase PRDM6 [Nematostella vectensis]XP_048588105.1 putative histone-lysine N-methyltransferase PRDM6 [Nematostella vectensis]XP_048588517.1 putative histone-lysine N-methyltransferase PRDM6 [Nematostella vectensis]XP_048588859.1 putative histone-lysine N-methyltransferase PRDM6 [Nematostella vectensis]
MASSSSDTEFQDSPGRDQISWEDLYSYLYGHVTLKPLEPLDLKAIRCKRRRDSESSIDGTVPVKSPRSSPPLAAFVFPDEVRLCKSSIPGAKFGVCAAHPIPPGTWIGPFEGQIVTREEVIKRELDTSYMWEIYKEGRFSHYIDGKDEHLSSWMRFIQCARYQEEQNMTVFQYCGNIYYRAYKHIPKGRELRVWYDDKYSELIDIPALLKGQKDGGVYWKSPSNGHVRDNELFYHRENRPIDGGNPHMTHHQSLYPVDLKDATEPSIWRCGQCSQTFSQRVLLQMHICSQAPDKPYQCGHCPASFQEASDLRDHVVSHINEKPFKCGFCGRSFAGATTLNNHIRTHTGEKPFKCLKCNKQFTQSTQLSRHQKSPEECVGSKISS